MVSTEWVENMVNKISDKTPVIYNEKGIVAQDIKDALETVREWNERDTKFCEPMLNTDEMLTIQKALETVQDLLQTGMMVKETINIVVINSNHRHEEYEWSSRKSLVADIESKKEDAPDLDYPLLEVNTDIAALNSWWEDDIYNTVADLYKECKNELEQQMENPREPEEPER